VTSPELGPLFGAVVARAFDAWWDDLGRPDPFVVVEAAAGAGTLARAVLDAAPTCAPAMRYLLVERSPALRERQHASVAAEPAAWVLGPAAAGDDEDEGRRSLPGRGPLVASLAELPVGPLDNLAFALLERRGGAWLEVRVGEGDDGQLEEVLAPALPALAAEADRHAPDPPEGSRIPLQHQAQEWLRRALRLLERGRVVVVDYVATTEELARRPWQGWIRTYRGHGRGGHPLDQPGDQDITCEVAADQLGRVRVPAIDRSQADFLRAHGLDELVEAARAEWRERAPVGDLEALRARSRVSEAAALTDLAGLGSLRVLEWVA
jgi:SAM-dependent MidA family methyltransferase